jgi:putative spermidine/putrescine transport system permease protein
MTARQLSASHADAGVAANRWPKAERSAPAAPATSKLIAAAPLPALSIRWGLVSLPGLALLIFSFGAPVVCLAAKSFETFTGPGLSGSPLTLDNFILFMTDAHYIGVFFDTLLLGLIVVTCCAALGYPVAFFLARMRSRWRGLLIFVVFGPLLISGVIRNLGWMPMLGANGFINWLLLTLGLVDQPVRLLNNFIGVVIGTVHAMLPFMILMLMTVIQRISPALEEAALNLGATPWRKFWFVVFPLSLPGLIGGYLIVFTLTISAYTTPAMLGGNRVTVMSTFIAQQVRYVLNYPFGATSAVILMIAAIAITLLATRLAGQRS